jgi:sulfur carrier protein ThiS
MNITVDISRNNEVKKIQIDPGSKVEDVLKKISLKPDGVIVIHDSQPIPIDEKLKDGQKLTILQVSSGG